MFSTAGLFRSTRITRRFRTLALHLAAAEIWIIVPLILASMISTRVLPWAVGVAALFWGMRYLAWGRLSSRTPADWPIALLVFMIPATLWATALPEITTRAIYRLLTGIALYYVIVNWATSKARLCWLVRALPLAGLLLALGALVSVQWSADGELVPALGLLYAYLPLLVSDSVNPNVMAGALVMLLPCSLAWFLFGHEASSWRYLIAVATASLVMILVLVLTQSRGGLMGLGTCLIVMTILRWKRGWLLALLVAIAGGIALRWLGVATILNALLANNTLGGLSTRLEVWSRALYMIEDFPFAGIGMGSFREVADVLYPLFTTSRDMPHAHNLFLQIAVDLGIPGLIAWLAIWMLAIFVAYRLYRDGRAAGRRESTGLGAGLLGSQMALAVHGMVDAVTWGDVRTAVLIWVVWGLTMAAQNVSRREADGRPAQGWEPKAVPVNHVSLPEGEA